MRASSFQRASIVSVAVGLALFPSLIPTATAQDTAASPAAASFSLADLEQMALRGNPTLSQAGANIEDARGRAIQSRLYPNPTVGYVGEQIGTRGRQAPGEMEGMFIDQIIVTAGKLRLNQAKYAQETAMMHGQAAAQQFRVVNGVRVRYYQLLAMRRLIDIRVEMLKLADDIVTTSEELVNVGQANKADVLQARIEARQERVGLQNARALYFAAWQQLAAFVGNPGLGEARLQGDLDQGCSVPEYEASLTHLLDASPEIQIARAEVQRDQFALRREQVEPIPNVQARVATGYNFTDEARLVTTTVNVGVRLPVFNRNQGNIHSAQAQLARAHAEVERVELSLKTRLARQYARHRTALAVVENYRAGNLPDARESFLLYLDSFRKRRAAYPQVLIAQRNYFQLSTDYVQALENLRRAEVSILGLLLVDGLDEPPGPPGEGRFQNREQPPDLPDPISSRQGRSQDESVGNRPPQGAD